MIKKFFISSVGIALFSVLLIGFVYSRQLSDDNESISQEKSSISKEILIGNVVTAKPVSSPNLLRYSIVANPNDEVHVTFQKMNANEKYEDILSFDESLSNEGVSQEHQYKEAGKYKIIIEDKSNNTTAIHTIVVPEN
ncbi:hypothetical protein GC098_29710 [Paenibacillus sp. LMG 31458]|uniref:Uncharacterized protein n=1 Tax=Paenibacillus phytorum TaxID=2654977 RepID=A0ABX1Y6B5_9BACL|nr:hypothetical protein [Paenibacillus phytorum]NOU75503.1 hypothetical protein [Paenibacillus phytorum]